MLADPRRRASDRSRIEPARQMDADGHVAAHVQPDCVFEELRKALGGIVDARGGSRPNVPIPRFAITSRFERIFEAAARGELPDVAIERFLCLVQAAIDQKRSGNAVVELILVVTGGSYRLDLRGKDETSRVLEVVKRLDAEGIPGA